MQAKSIPDREWLGTRDFNKPGGPYVWMTWKEVESRVEALAKAF
jgi:hypothetical protein